MSGLPIPVILFENNSNLVNKKEDDSCIFLNLLHQTHNISKSANSWGFFPLNANVYPYLLFSFSQGLTEETAFHLMVYTNTNWDSSLCFYKAGF